MGRENRITGLSGEETARRFLMNKGYRILGNNVRTPFGEIDIIARHKRTMVFIEVKCRISSSLGPPYLSITKKKERHIIRNALFYLKKKNLLWSDWRIDIISAKLNNRYEVEMIEHFVNAVEDDYV